MSTSPPSVLAVFSGRTSAFDESREYRLNSDALEIKRYLRSAKNASAAPLVETIPYPAITQIRLRYFPTRVQTNRYECIVSTRGLGEFKFTNEIFRKVLTFEDRSAEFRTFARELCRMAADRSPQARFVRGRSLTPYVLEHGFLVAMLAFLAYILWLVGGSMRGVAAVKFAILCFYIPIAVKYAITNRPAPFDPRNVPDDILPAPAPGAAAES